MYVCRGNGVSHEQYNGRLGRVSLPNLYIWQELVPVQISPPEVGAIKINNLWHDVIKSIFCYNTLGRIRQHALTFLKMWSSCPPLEQEIVGSNPARVLGFTLKCCCIKLASTLFCICPCRSNKKNVQTQN
jgi:hypothetical protein